MVNAAGEAMRPEIIVGNVLQTADIHQWNVCVGHDTGIVSYLLVVVLVNVGLNSGVPFLSSFFSSNI